MVQQRNQISSWTIPLVVSSSSGKVDYNATSRTLCQEIVSYGPERYTNESQLVVETKEDDQYVIITTESSYELYVSLKVEEDWFILEPGIEYNITISPSEPRLVNLDYINNVNSSEHSINFHNIILVLS